MPIKPDELDVFIELASSSLDLPVAPAWKAMVRTNLDVILRFAELVSSFELPNDAEPAPIYRA